MGTAKRTDKVTHTETVIFHAPQNMFDSRTKDGVCLTLNTGYISSGSRQCHRLFMTPDGHSCSRLGQMQMHLGSPKGWIGRLMILLSHRFSQSLDFMVHGT